MKHITHGLRRPSDIQSITVPGLQLIHVIPIFPLTDLLTKAESRHIPSIQTIPSHSRQYAKPLHSNLKYISWNKTWVHIVKDPKLYQSKIFFCFSCNLSFQVKSKMIPAEGASVLPKALPFMGCASLVKSLCFSLLVEQEDNIRSLPAVMGYSEDNFYFKGEG